LSKKKRPASSKSPNQTRPKKPKTAPGAFSSDTKPVSGAYKEHLKKPWLDAFAQFRTIHAACVRVPVARRTIQEWRKNDAAFAAAYYEAEIGTNDLLEHTALYRAINGDQKPVIHQGRAVLDAKGNPLTVKTHSDAMQIFLLKCRIPGKYQERIKQELDLRIVNILIAEVMLLLRRSIPDMCPHCKTKTNLAPKIAHDLETLSAKLGSAANNNGPTS
jgi:hypothetical protein